MLPITDSADVESVHRWRDVRSGLNCLQRHLDSVVNSSHLGEQRGLVVAA